MSTMLNVNILNSSILSSQGDLNETLLAIKNNDIKIASQDIPTLDEIIPTPYFLLQEKIQEDKSAIYGAMKKIVLKLLEGLDTKQKEETALIIGTSQIDLNIVDAVVDTLYDNKEYASKKKSIDTYAKDISNELGLNGYTMTISTACTSSVNALLEAKNLISVGAFKYAVVLGVEIFSQMMSSGFSSMKLLSLKPQKPFDKNRDGLVLGEALAGVLVGVDDAKWSLEGGYSNASSYTITAAGEDGDEFYEVISKALASLNLEAKDITALKAHATSSTSNDLSEINAISRIFSDDLIFTALKPYIGHTLGACGVLELALFMAAIDDGFIPKTINTTEPILENYKPLSKEFPCHSGTFMLNYFGFGGNNVSMIIKKRSA